MNSDLKDKKFKIDSEILSQINSVINRYNEGGDTKGLKRAKDLMASKEMSYAQIKRIKNYFDKYEGDNTDTEYLLNGGDEMKKWVNRTLEQNRDSIDKGKKIKSSVMDNAYRKEHTKGDKLNGKETKVYTPRIDKSSGSDYLMNNKTVYETEIKKMLYLIEYMDNNNNKIL